MQFSKPKVFDNAMVFGILSSMSSHKLTYFLILFRMGTLIIFAVLSGLAGLATLRLPDTKGVPTPSSAEEVCSSSSVQLLSVAPCS